MTSPPNLQLYDATAYYNTERPHRGYGNRGKRPMDTVNVHLILVRQEG